MFNNCDSKTNGENLFYNRIKDSINIIFDVGCRNDSDYLDFKREVHYFDPDGDFIEQLSKMNSSNSPASFNKFGLGQEASESYYFPAYQSFYDRVKSCQISDDSNKVIKSIRTGKSYVTEKNIETIDFLKIDTEGYELNVLLGFDDFLSNIGIIQFEYGGTFLDNNTTLNDVIEYLKKYGFHKFSYLTNTGTHLITDFQDHYQYCNIVCVNQNSVHDSLIDEGHITLIH